MGELRLTFVNVGYGEAMVLECPDPASRGGTFVMVIDGGSAEPEEYAGGTMAGFVSIPVDELRERMGEIPAGKPVYLLCQSGLRSYIAARILGQAGYECYNFAGGYRLYESVARDRLAAEQAHPCGMDRR